MDYFNILTGDFSCGISTMKLHTLYSASMMFNCTAAKHEPGSNCLPGDSCCANGVVSSQTGLYSHPYLLLGKFMNPKTKGLSPHIKLTLKQHHSAKTKSVLVKAWARN